MKIPYYEGEKCTRKSSILAVTAIILIIIVLSHVFNGSVSPPYLDAFQLTQLNGSTIGTVIDTEELQIDVVNIVSSKYEANITLRITAKQLDTVMYDSGWGDVALNNYRFGVENHGTIFENASHFSCRYIYSDTTSQLLSNQFYLILSIFSLHGFNHGSYTIELQKFGYYKKSPNPQENIEVTVLYEGPWTINLILSGDIENSKMLLVNQKIMIDGHSYTIDKIYLTAFSCTAILSNKSRSEILGEDFSKISKDLSALKIYTIDGQIFKDAQPIVVGGKESDDKAFFYIFINFDAPININKITKICIVKHDIITASM